MDNDITTEWLQGIGFGDEDGPSLTLELGDFLWLIVQCQYCDDGALALHTDERWHIYCDSVGAVVIDDLNVTTRDDVRALVRMLGGKLNESEES